MSKIYNTPEYRNLKRVVSFVDPIIKSKITKTAKKKKISVSKEIANALFFLYAD